MTSRARRVSALALLAAISLTACASAGQAPRPTPPGDTCPPGRNLVCYDKEAPDSGAVLNDRFCRCERVLNIP